MFRRNISPPFSGSKNELRKNSRPLFATCVHAGFLLDLFFDLEDGGDMFLRNVGLLSRDYTALYPRRQYSLYLYSPTRHHGLVFQQR
jgi:hypothetical protein